MKTFKDVNEAMSLVYNNLDDILDKVTAINECIERGLNDDRLSDVAGYLDSIKRLATAGKEAIGF